MDTFSVFNSLSFALVSIINLRLLREIPSVFLLLFVPLRDYLPSPPVLA